MAYRAGRGAVLAARAEFKHLEHFYFHNCIYESVWKDNRRRGIDRIPLDDILRTYAGDYRVIFVGDAAMSPYEIVMPGGSVEHWNEIAGRDWLARLTGHFGKVAWLNPVQEHLWGYTQSVQMLRDLMAGRMYPLTLDGLERATRALVR